ncbi:unnamed protein product [Danaus chrysippus]|uniref:(African queen) hypothetical protein n=1 Tax=Danaus chrysippus TaxID=151541 RepID=A0A8J2QH97_9NEOP|nr:unnamed protein product [Danaus chrysippus]
MSNTERRDLKLEEVASLCETDEYNSLNIVEMVLEEASSVSLNTFNNPSARSIALVKESAQNSTTRKRKVRRSGGLEEGGGGGGGRIEE